MYQVRFELTSTLDPTDQPSSTLQPFPNPMQMQHPLDLSRSNTIVLSEGYHDGSTSYTGPVYQGMAPDPSHQFPNQYRPPGSGPSRNRRRKGSRKAEHPYRILYSYESPGAVPHDRSTGIDPGMARNDTSKNPRRGKVWRTPSKNLFMTDCNLT